MHGVVVHTWTKFSPMGSLFGDKRKVQDVNEYVNNRCGHSAVSRSLERGYAPIEHGVEGSNFIDSHGWYLHELGDIVHDADARPSFVLTLPEIEKWDDGGFLVLRWVM